VPIFTYFILQYCIELIHVLNSKSTEGIPLSLMVREPPLVSLVTKPQTTACVGSNPTSVCLKGLSSFHPFGDCGPKKT